MLQSAVCLQCLPAQLLHEDVVRVLRLVGGVEHAHADRDRQLGDVSERVEADSVEGSSDRSKRLEDLRDDDSGPLLHQ